MPISLPKFMKIFPKKIFLNSESEISKFFIKNLVIVCIVQI